MKFIELMLQFQKFLGWHLFIHLPIFIEKYFNLEIHMTNNANPTNIDDATLAVSGAGIAQTADAVREVMAGKPYLWGGKTVTGFDCSGYVSYVLRQLFPNSGALYQLDAAGFASSSLLVDVPSEADRRPGDIIYFSPHAGSPAHVGIVYDGQFWIGSQSSTGVAKVKFSNPYWHARPQKIRRLTNLSVATISAGQGFMVAAWA